MENEFSIVQRKWCRRSKFSNKSGCLFFLIHSNCSSCFRNHHAARSSLSHGEVQAATSTTTGYCQEHYGFKRSRVQSYNEKYSFKTTAGQAKAPKRHCSPCHVQKTKREGLRHCTNVPHGTALG